MKSESLLVLHKKKDTKSTADVETKLRASSSSSLKTWRIRDKIGEGVIVIFKNPKHITQFEAVLLYSFFTGKRPRDYADYHKCIAGKKFFDTIDSITFLEQITKIVEGRTIKDDD
jgi:hypothetical protein